MALSRLAAAQLLQDDKAGAEDNLALRYQLITEKTSFLLMHQRPDAARATDMPALHQVKQMTPAGWGGSTVHKDSSSVHGIQWNKQNFDLPVANLYRKSFEHQVNRKGGLSEKNVEYVDSYEIPHFLRRGVDADGDQKNFNTGDKISLRRSQFWFKLTASGARLRALIHRRRAGQGVRIWFFNDQDEAFELIDCADRASALQKLQELGYSKMPHALKDLLPKGKIKLTWVGEIILSF